MLKSSYEPYLDRDFMKSIALTGLIAAGTIALAACSTQPSQHSAHQQQTAKNNNHLVKVCTSHAPTGSHLKKVNCVTMTKEQYKEYQKAEEKRHKESVKALQKRENSHDVRHGTH